MNQAKLKAFEEMSHVAPTYYKEDGKTFRITLTVNLGHKFGSEELLILGDRPKFDYLIEEVPFEGY